MEKKLPAVEIDLNFCKGCGLCIENCPPDCLIISKQFNVLGYQYATYKGSGCTGCEDCYYVCPEPAVISVRKEIKEKPARPRAEP